MLSAIWSNIFIPECIQNGRTQKKYILSEYQLVDMFMNMMNILLHQFLRNNHLR